MSMTDPIADLLIRLTNASKRGHAMTTIPASKLKTNILKVFQSEGFIRSFQEEKVQGHSVLKVELRYLGSRDKKSVITGVRRISKPGCRVYVGKQAVPRVMDGLGVAILSTPKGVVTDRESRQLGQGGEVLCYVW